MCWWNHNLEMSKVIKCFICGKSFQNKNEMMKHRKRDHWGIVKLCLQYSKNNCRFKDEQCWFKHELEIEINEDQENLEEQFDDDKMETVFREVSED